MAMRGTSLGIARRLPNWHTSLAYFSHEFFRPPEPQEPLEPIPGGGPAQPGATRAMSKCLGVVLSPFEATGAQVRRRRQPQSAPAGPFA